MKAIDNHIKYINEQMIDNTVDCAMGYITQDVFEKREKELKKVLEEIKAIRNEMYTNLSGATMHVEPTGQTFKVTIEWPATKHSKAETVTKRPRTYAGVERLIKRYNFKAAA